jgi:hypothetical protein
LLVETNCHCVENETPKVPAAFAIE